MGLHIGSMLADQCIQALDVRFKTTAFIANRSKRCFTGFLLMNQHVGASGEDRRQDLAHTVAKFDVSAGLAGLTLQRIPLTVDFRQNVIHAGKVESSSFQP